MVTKIQKWGNSLGLRIPKTFAAEAHVRAGAEVDLAIQEGRLVVSPLKPRKYTLAALLGKITSKNIHAESWTDGPAGREVL